MPRRTVYYRPVKTSPKVRPELVEPIKQLIDEELSFGYRTVAGLLSMYTNTVQRPSRSRLAGKQARDWPAPANPSFAVSGERT